MIASHSDAVPKRRSQQLRRRLRRSTRNTRRRRTVFGKESDSHRLLGGVQSRRDGRALVDEDFEHGVVAPDADAQGLCCFFSRAGFVRAEGCEEGVRGCFWLGVDEGAVVERGAGDGEGFGGGGEGEGGCLGEVCGWGLLVRDGMFVSG